jgi:antitoxin (DNA-binding transcriptional repressor) of toxin-antitoxin stability system
MSPELEFVYELNANLAPTVTLGQTPTGLRRIVDILDGAFAGPRLRGTIRPGGADWQIVRPDQVTELHAHYILQTDDGVLIQVNVRGLRNGPAEVLRRIANGESVDPGEYYFRIAPVFEAPAGPYEWLNRSLFVGRGERSANGVRLIVFRVC